MTLVTKELSNLDHEAIETLVQANVIPQGTPPAQIALFQRTCQMLRMSPFAGEIHLVGYKDWKTGKMKYAVMVGIGAARRKASETGQFAGKDDAKFDLRPDGGYKTMYDLKSQGKLPTTCTVTVYRMISGQKVSFTATVSFWEVAKHRIDKETQKPVLMQSWRTMPLHMVAKCAEANALRMGFNDVMGNAYVKEERAAFENNTKPNIVSPEQVQGRKEALSSLREKLASIDKVEGLLKYFRENNHWSDDQDVIDIFTERKNQIDAK